MAKLSAQQEEDMNDDDIQDAANQFPSSYGRHSEVPALGRRRLTDEQLREMHDYYDNYRSETTR